MLTDLERDRCRAFKRWAHTLPGDDKYAAAQELTGMHMRTLQRIMAGKRPPPVQMLARLGDHAQANGHPDLAAELVELGETNHTARTWFGRETDGEKLRGSANGYMAIDTDEGIVEISGRLDAIPTTEDSGNA